ncbi:MAG: hypothetical protein GEV06_21470, partial [Luteitalea sp.]|nr:hypothetical protein [Luteitalea sp.]
MNGVLVRTLPTMAKPDPTPTPRIEPSRLVALLGCLAIVLASVAAVVVWTALTQPLALVEALGRGGVRELATLLVARLIETVAE